VPFTKQVHDRLSLEVLRGCTQGCRFCQAGMTTRPVRERSLDHLDNLLERTLASTGYEEVSLVSLSTCDYSRVRALVEQTVERARPDHVTVSLPSLRLDSYSVDLSDMVADQRKSGITFAPEAASPRLRALINKWIPDEELLDMTGQVYERGWDHIKLYFMIGLPTERDDDIEAIADLCLRTWRQGRDKNPKAKVNLGVSTFVPKPFTPFQWAAQIGPEETDRKQHVLAQALGRNGAIKFGRHSPNETFLEGLVSRYDRRAADLIESAWRHGARFDAWSEHLNMGAWRAAIQETGFDVADALRERDVAERLPWDHLDVLMPKAWFAEDWQRAMALRHAEDCRHKRCHKCGVIDAERDLCAWMLRDNIEGRKLEKQWERKPIVPRVEALPVQRLWFRIARTGAARFLAHLEALNAWIRSLRRARAPLAYSQGFHPHPKVAFNCATPMNEETTGDFMDVLLTERVDAALLLDRLRATLPTGFDVLGVRDVPLHAPSLMSIAKGAVYTLFLPDEDRADIAAKIEALLARDRIVVKRQAKVHSKRMGKKEMKDLDIRPMIRALTLHHDAVAVDVTFADVDGKPGKPKDIVALLTASPESARILKRETLLVEASAWGRMPAEVPEAEESEAPQG
jgi:radical SAM-linked protein